MKRLAKSESRKRGEQSKQERPLVFLDTNVIVEYLRGDSAARQLFSAQACGRARFAINPIVLQEMLLTGNAAGSKFDRIRDNLRILPADLPKAEALLTRVRNLRNRVVHSNDLLILSSADECDFLVTRDERLKNLMKNDKPQVVTPEELVTRLRAA